MGAQGFQFYCLPHKTLGLRVFPLVKAVSLLSPPRVTLGERVSFWSM